MNNEINIPNHVGIIMDGNGRWAKARGLKRTRGHAEGYKTLKKLAVHILKRGVKYLSVFAFSTENFKRDESEVKFLMDLFVDKISTEKDFFMDHNIKVVFSGVREHLRSDVLESMKEISEYTKDNTGGVFNILLNYGAQTEIVEACKEFARDVLDGKIKIEELNTLNFYKYLHQDLPPVDFMIRTSGEVRVSNFMLYQIAYAEMYFPEVYFPDFNEIEFDKALEIYNNRDRRFGGVKDEQKK